MDPDINAHCERELAVELLTWIILGLVGLGLLAYLLTALIRPEKW
ncbi:K(+)-transporting ATPase subunit F [Arthrobacter antibioticus]|nr:K(+)-transporting ATPase subunit F [Arthrobacter sp. H35-MC1]MDJ0316966.1 K(+)-transporting ATPase subunit F [Arthrobacter sp. H35-MC1]